MTDSENPDDCIVTMAEVYAAAIRQIQPHGPYLLGGWSMGGLVAVEMARLLQADGEETRLLAMLDTFPIGGANDQGNWVHGNFSGAPTTRS